MTQTQQTPLEEIGNLLSTHQIGAPHSPDDVAALMGTALSEAPGGYDFAEQLSSLFVHSHDIDTEGIPRIRGWLPVLRHLHETPSPGGLAVLAMLAKLNVDDSKPDVGTTILSAIRTASTELLNDIGSGTPDPNVAGFIGQLMSAEQPQYDPEDVSIGLFAHNLPAAVAWATKHVPRQPHAPSEEMDDAAGSEAPLTWETSGLRGYRINPDKLRAMDWLEDFDLETSELPTAIVRDHSGNPIARLIDMTSCDTNLKDAVRHYARNARPSVQRAMQAKLAVEVGHTVSNGTWGRRPHVINHGKVTTYVAANEHKSNADLARAYFVRLGTYEGEDGSILPAFGLVAMCLTKPQEAIVLSVISKKRATKGVVEG